MTKNLLNNNLLLSSSQTIVNNSFFDAMKYMYIKLKDVFTFTVPFIENIILFSIIHLIINNGYPESAQLLIFYIIFISAVFDRAQMFIGIVLSVILFTLNKSAYSSLYLTVSEYTYIFTVLIMIVSGFIVSALKDKLTAIKNDKDFIIETQSKEIEELNIMLDTSRDIKAELESRLLNHSDSLSKIYEIVSRLDAVETRKVFMGALKVVSDIMHSNDVSIYMSGNNSSYFRCAASSTLKARESMQNSIKISEYPEMYEMLKNEKVFVNRELNENLPIMALAIGDENDFNVIIMLWSIDFNDLGLYHINLFLVLRMIISSSINRAYQYELATHEQRYYPNTIVLRKEYFSEILQDQQQIKSDTNMPYQFLHIKTDTDNLPELSSLLSGSLRATDYIGFDSSDTLSIILGGTGENDLPYVIKRLDSKGIITEQIAV